MNMTLQSISNEPAIARSSLQAHMRSQDTAREGMRFPPRDPVPSGIDGPYHQFWS
ncbi:hypothetical protein PISMIDRAFT_551247 [Pisolithus microcarpus 441]|uniref:Uncharacterized protein n=1 Tax=Pisolithus microcarpus 441 TaxID=765257 RepID=A0A0D0A9R4_9AGAM|nr:hypothetical protein PISMIDRAFT_551247 [Pisolithus microcarpus 441]